MLKIAILGSVVLKNATDFLDQKSAATVLYAPKLSLAVMLDNVVPIVPNNLFPSNLDGFTRKLITSDIRKSFFTDIEKTRPNRDQLKVDPSGVFRNIPNVWDRVYIATGAKFIGGITIGHHSIVGANAVVTTDVPPFSVVAGNPAEIINGITRENLSRYASYFYKGMSLGEASRFMFGDINAC